MAMVVFCFLVLAALAVTERCFRQFFFAATALASTAGMFLLVVGDIERAVLLAALLAIAIVGSSKVKYHHSGIKLTAADLALASAGTIPFLVVQYRRAAMATLAAGLALILATLATLLQTGNPSLPLNHRVLFFASALGACAFAYWISGGARSFQSLVTQRCCFFSTFMASLIDVRSWWRSPGLSIRDIAKDPLPFITAAPARSTVRPDIILIQHESVFDPRLFGLAVEPNVEAFLSPANSLSGTLNVDIYGGGSWQSEFSLLTGLSSAAFGPDAYFIFQKGVDRFHHTLPRELTALGYKTMLASSCRRSFLNYDAFYRSIGIPERIFSDDFPPPFDVGRFERTNSDAVFLEAALGTFINRVSDDPTPRLIYALTNFNHGPHTRQLVPPAHFSMERAFATASLPDPQYIEYYTRLAETAATWRRLKSRLATLFPNRPMLIVHYGDHQPVMTRRIEQLLRLPEDERRCFQTFYAMEGLNFPIYRSVYREGSVFDIALLGTVALQIAGLPLDEISATRASLIKDCGDGHYALDSDRMRHLHRTLVDMSLIDVAPVAQPSGSV
jgi:hypothetical protein